MKPDIKICGLKTEAAVEAAIAGGASHVGFIFFPKSPRNIDPEEAALLSGLAKGRARQVAVTVDMDDEALDRIVRIVAPDMLQLHGKESPQRVREVRARYGLPVMKALAIRDAGDLDAVAAYRDIVDRFLFDAKPPVGAELPGGNGISFDWRLLASLDGSIDYMLSGGLNRENVLEALRLTRAPGLDVSSGVEIAPGVKDIGLIADFLKTARGRKTESARQGVLS